MGQLFVFSKLFLILLLVFFHGSNERLLKPPSTEYTVPQVSSSADVNAHGEALKSDYLMMTYGVVT